MTAAYRHRTAVVAFSLAGFVAVAVAYVFLEVPGLGIAHFFYVPVAALALTAGPRRGIVAGFCADGFYALAVLLNPHIPSAEILSVSTLIRLVTYGGIGALVGWFAANDRALVERLRILAERDFLTGLPNTRAFEAAITRRLETGRAFALLLGDMDRLKAINDERGHAEGNDTLRSLAEMLGTALRPEDEVARVGGDEFAVLTSLTAGEEAAAACARLESVLAAHKIAITFGWALFPGEGANALSLYRAADERLYARKLVRGEQRRGAGLYSVGA